MQNSPSIIDSQAPPDVDAPLIHNSPVLGNMSAGLRKKPLISLLTGGSDRPYVFGLTTSLLAEGLQIEMIGSDELDLPEFRDLPALTFLNLRGSSLSDSRTTAKVSRILRYYVQLVRYAATTSATHFHILWNNKFETFDRTILMLYYRMLGKKIVFTVHNVNAARRDGKDSYLNRATLAIQYRLAHHLFVHTDKMRSELISQFSVPQSNISRIPFGINNAVPRTRLTYQDARELLGLKASDKVILFFGRITPYKGLEYLIQALRMTAHRVEGLRLVIAGRVDRCEDYWSAIRRDIRDEVDSGKIIVNAEFIPDAETEIYFKAADVLALPYRDIYQSGVLFLAQSFGLPVLASDAGSLQEDITEGENGFIFSKESATGLTDAIVRYFESPLYFNLGQLRDTIRQEAARKHSWSEVAHLTAQVYESLAPTS